MKPGKTTLAAFLALAACGIAGLLAARAHFISLVRAAEAERDNARNECATLKRHADEAQKRAGALESENASLLADLKRAKTAVSFMAPQPVELPPEPAMAALEEPAEDPPPPDDRERRRGRRDPRQQDGAAENGQPDAATRDTRRGEFAAQMRQRVDDFMTAEVAKSTEPEAQERLAALHERVNELMDLYQQMRAAETDEARDALRETVMQTRETIRALAEEQQDYMLRQVTSQYGITDPTKQEQFLDALRETQQSPMFRVPGMGFGGDGRGFGGGFFGGFGRPPTPATQ